MKLKILINFLLFFCLISSKIYSQVSIVLRPDSVAGKDALLDSQYPTVNNGTTPDFAAWSWTRNQGLSLTNARSLIEFDLSSIPNCAVINSAKISLYCNTTSSVTQLNSGNNAFSIQRITSNWSENSVTWNNQPSSTTLNQVSLAQSTSSTQNYENIDITNLIKDIKQNPTTSFGLMIKLLTESTYRSIIMSSSDHADSTKWPKLVIDYTSPPLTNNTINISQNTFCAGILYPSITGSIPIGGDGTFSYNWIVSTTNANVGFSNAGGVNNLQNYTPINLNVNTWFKRITYSCGSIDTSEAIALTILPKPITSFSINNNAQCLAGNNFILTDNTSFSGIGGYTRLWNLGNGSTDTSSLANLSKSYNTSGSYTIKLLTIGNNGCKDSLTQSVTTGVKPIAGFTINSSNQCLNNNNFTFTDTSMVNSGTLTRVWNLGSPNNTSTLVSTNKTFTLAGNYTIKLISNNLGCRDTITKTVSVFPNAKIGFYSNNGTQCLNGNNFVFNDTSSVSNGTLTRNWDFGNNTFDNSSIAFVNYTTPNSYPVKLVVITNNGCKDSLIKTVNVISNPNVGFMLNNSEQCLNGNNFIFTDTSKTTNGNLSRTWNFGTGVNDISSIINPTKTYFNSGIYQVKLLVNNNGCKDSITKSITVFPKPVVGFIINNTTQCLRGNNFIFNDTSSISAGNYTRNWSFGNGTFATSSGVNTNYENANNYSIKLVITSNNGCKDSLSKLIIVNANPIAGFTINNKSQCLVGNSFSFIDTSITTNGNLQRLWNFGNNESSNSINPNKSYTEANVYNVKLVITASNGCKDSVVNTVSVNPKPTVGFTVNNYSQCLKGNNFIFNDTSVISNRETLTSSWDFGDTSFATAKTFSKSYGNLNNYVVKLLVTSANNCKDSLSKIVTLNPSTAAMISANGKTDFCQGENVLLIANSGNGLSYNWLNNGVKIINELNSTLTANTNGVHKAVVTNSFGCKDTSNPLNIIVNSIPNIGNINGIVNANTNDTFTYFVTPQSGFGYTWYAINGTILNGQGNNLVKVKWSNLGSGNLKVLVSNAKLCLDSSKINVSILNTGISDLLATNFTVFPNPTKSILTINSNNILVGNKFTITNLIGQVIITGKLNLDETIVNTESLAIGMYLLSIEGVNKQAIKIIKE